MPAFVLSIVAGTLMAARCAMVREYHRPAAPISNIYPTDGMYATQPERGAAAAVRTSALRPISASVISLLIRDCRRLSKLPRGIVAICVWPFSTSTLIASSTA